MNGIVRVTNKPANIIDTLRSDLAKEARRLADVLRLATALLGHPSQERCRSRVDACRA